MIKKYRKLLLAVVVLLFAGLLGWNIYLQRELYKYKPQVEAYLPEELEQMLRQAGFRQIKQYGELRMRPPRLGEQRIFFAARKEF